jgi:ATP-dependent protease ClpP protease subunit
MLSVSQAVFLEGPRKAGMPEKTGQSVERVRKDTDRNYWMSASEAIDHGLAFKIVTSIEDLK